MTCDLETPYILIHEKKLSSLQPMLPGLEAVVESGRPLQSLPKILKEKPFTTLVVNKLRGGLKVAVKAPVLVIAGRRYPGRYCDSDLGCYQRGSWH